MIWEGYDQKDLQKMAEDGKVILKFTGHLISGS